MNQHQFFLAMTCLCVFLTTSSFASIGYVSLLKGEASARRDHQTVALFTSSAVEKNDIITTSANTQMQMTFEDKTVITLGSNSVLNIEEYLNDEQNPQAKFKFSQGTFKSITGQIGKKAPQNFHLETKTATIGIRGTTVIGAIGENGNPDTLGCLIGSISVSNSMGSVVLTPGFFTVISNFAPPPPPVSLSPSQLQQLFSSVLSSTPPPPLPEGMSGGTPESFSRTPPVASSAINNNLQTLTFDDIDTYITDTGDGFYPRFNPTLQATSNHAGTLSLSGFATSAYTNSDGISVTSTTDTLALAINSNSDSLLNTETAFSQISLDRSQNSTFLNLTKSSNGETMTYKDINKFSVKDFDAYQGWIMTDNTYANDYVSWGYWALKANDDTLLLPTTNYWVAGKDAGAANEYVMTLMGNSDTSTTSYAYNGHVIGTVSDGANNYAIDPTTNNAVQLDFDFGGGSGTVKNTSYLQFQTSQATPQVWKISPSGSFSNGTFSLSNEASVAINGTTDNASTSLVKGGFFGNSAQGVGGTFNASSGSNSATGVFKAVHP